MEGRLIDGPGVEQHPPLRLLDHHSVPEQAPGVRREEEDLLLGLTPLGNIAEHLAEPKQRALLIPKTGQHAVAEESRAVAPEEPSTRLGTPRAVRAVGAANGANPIPIVIPCHRVIGADGRLVGYGGGLERKRWLLAHEGVRSGMLL